MGQTIAGVFNDDGGGGVLSDVYRRPQYTPMMQAMFGARTCDNAAGQAAFSKLVNALRDAAGLDNLFLDCLRPRKCDIFTNRSVKEK